jgi:hypothetical protein
MPAQAYGAPAQAAYDPQPPYGAQPQQPQQAANPYGVQAPYGGQQGYDQPPAQAQAAGNPAYVATQTAGPAGPLGETAAGRPVDPAVLQRRGSPNRLAPILVALVAVLLLGGAVAAWVVMGKRAHPETTAQAGSAQPSASAPAPPPAAADSASAAPADTASAAPADSASAAPDADAGPAAVMSTLACDPECDTITLDDHPIELGKPLTIAAGKHVVVATKDGYLPIRELVKVKDGEKVEKTYKLKEKPAAAATAATVPGPVPTGPAKPCGKFLKRCK